MNGNTEVYNIRNKRFLRQNIEKDPITNRNLLTSKDREKDIDKGKEKEEEKLHNSGIKKEITKDNNNKNETNFYNFFINDNQKNKEAYNFKNNKIDTTKYNIFTFLPKG
jgi:hypothetical protein